MMTSDTAKGAVRFNSCIDVPSASVRLLVYATPVVLHRGYLPRSRGRAWATIRPSCRSDHLAKCQLQDWSLGSPSAWSGGEHEPYCEPGCTGSVFRVAFFNSRTPRRRSPDLAKISLDCWSTVRHDDIVFILWRSHGCRRKSELATLRGDQRRSC